LLGIELNRGWY